MTLSVLVIDDSALMRSMVIKTLRLSGLPMREVHQAGNGEEGLQVLERSWIDLIVVDINMPQMNGEEFINRLHEDPAIGHLPILVISSESSEARIKRLEEKGVRFVHKPFTPEMVGAAAREIMGVTDVELP